MAVLSKVYACSRSIAGIPVSIRTEGMDVLSLMFVVCCKGSGLCDGQFTRSEEIYRLCLSTSTKRRPKPELGFFATENAVVTTTIRLITDFYHVV
jgi:hypothetical protein